MLIFFSQWLNVMLGAVFGACYAIGLGIPFWLVGTFAGSPCVGNLFHWFTLIDGFGTAPFTVPNIPTLISQT